MSRRNKRYLAAFSKIQLNSPKRVKYLLKVKSPLEVYLKAYAEVKNGQANSQVGEVVGE